MIDPNELFYPAVDLLRRLIATPSISREENATADLIAAYLQEYGFTPHRTANNVWAIAPDYTPGRPTVLLNSHTIPYGRSKGGKDKHLTPGKTATASTAWAVTTPVRRWYRCCRYSSLYRPVPNRIILFSSLRPKKRFREQTA